MIIIIIIVLIVTYITIYNIGYNNELKDKKKY